MFKNKITITGKRPSAAGGSFLWLALVFGSAWFGSPAIAAETNSIGPALDRFNLTLEQGCRTEAAGPFYYSQQTEDETIVAFPPFFSSVRNPSVENLEYDFFYPLLTSVHYGKERRWQLGQMFSSPRRFCPSSATAQGARLGRPGLPQRFPKLHKHEGKTSSSYDPLERR